MNLGGPGIGCALIVRTVETRRTYPSWVTKSEEATPCVPPQYRKRGRSTHLIHRCLELSRVARVPSIRCFAPDDQEVDPRVAR